VVGVPDRKSEGPSSILGGDEMKNEETERIHERATITKSDFAFEDSALVVKYRCPNCSKSELEEGYNYCPMCGEAVDWDLR